MSFAVSMSKVDITPTLATNPFMAGWASLDGGRVATSSTPYRPLYARAIVLWENGLPHIIMSLDVLGLPRSMHQRIRSGILALGLWADTSDILIQATHTHNGPALVDQLHPYVAYGLSSLAQLGSYSSWLETTVVALAKTALNAPRTSVTLDYKVAAQSFAFNRRALPYVETVVPVLTARSDPGGNPVAVIFSYGCHPVSGGMRTLFDGDFPAGACSYLESARPGCFAVFLQGAAGDQNPKGTFGWELRDTYATSLGSTVDAALNSPGRSVAGPLQTSYREVQLPLDITLTSQNMAAVRAAYVARLGNPDGQPAYFQRHAQTMIARIDSSNFATTVPSPFQVWKLSGSPALRIAMVGGELVSGYAVYFRSRYGGANGLLIGGNANETSGYIPSNEFFPPYSPGGSYEGGWESDHPGIAAASMAVYGHLAHFKAGANGVESTVINAMTAMLG
jgi:neutral ceramidase